MSINAEHLRQHFASLSDDELIGLDRNDLTDIGQRCYDDEIASRGIDMTQPADTLEEADSDLVESHDPPDEEIGDDESFIACAFTELGDGLGVINAEDAYQALKAAGIPCHTEKITLDPEPHNPAQPTELRVLVPNGFMMEAMSVLDKNIFNPRLESDWKNHLQSLTDAELRRLNADVICAGLVDRATRLRKAYLEELRRRDLSTSASSAQ